MAIQEAKLKALYEIKLMEENPKIYIESNPSGATNASAGVAFVLNKELLKNKKWKHTIIIEGRASRLQIDWTEDQGLDIITVYFPNETSEKLAFIKKLQQELAKIGDWSNPILMGDFNFVEGALDRHPARDDDNRLTQEMQKLKRKYKLVDGWRIHNPFKKEYTFTQGKTNSMSRIDRIYINRETYPYAINWEVQTSAQLSDHSFAYVEILREKLPYIGKGLWRLSKDSL